MRKRKKRKIKVKGKTVGKKTGVLEFVLLSYVWAYLIYLLIYLTGGLSGNIFALLLLPAVMFTPLFSTVLVSKTITKEKLRSFGVARGEVKYYLPAYIFPFLFIGLGVVFIFLTSIAPLDFSFSTSPVPMTPYIFAAVLAAPFFNMLFAFGEEYGWRGFLLPKLVKRHGLLLGIVLNGLIWGFWHAPLILMGYDLPNHADIFGVLVFSLWAVLVTFFLAWLRFKSGSVLTSALCHGAINAFAGFGFLISPGADELLATPFGVPALLSLFIIAAFCYNDVKTLKKLS